MKNKINSKVLILLCSLNVLQVKSISWPSHVELPPEAPLPRWMQPSRATEIRHVPGKHLFIANRAHIEQLAQLAPEFLSALRAGGPHFSNDLCDSICQAHNYHIDMSL